MPQSTLDVLEYFNRMCFCCTSSLSIADFIMSFKLHTISDNFAINGIRNIWLIY